MPRTTIFNILCWEKASLCPNIRRPLSLMFSYRSSICKTKNLHFFLLRLHGVSSLRPSVLLKRQTNNSGPLIISYEGKVITTSSVDCTLGKALQKLGSDPSLFSSQSFSIVRATDFTFCVTPGIFIKKTDPVIVRFTWSTYEATFSRSILWYFPIWRSHLPAQTCWSFATPTRGQGFFIRIK